MSRRRHPAALLLVITGIVCAAVGVVPANAAGSSSSHGPVCGAPTPRGAEPGCVLARYQVPASVRRGLGLDEMAPGEEAAVSARSSGPSGSSGSARSLPASAPLSTLSYPPRRSSAFLVLRMGDVIGPTFGAVGVDMSFADPAVNGGQPYVPCKNVADPFHGACVNPRDAGYFQEGGWQPGSTPPFPGGLVITNAGGLPNCPPPCQHSWSQRVARLDVEFYPMDSHGVNLADYVRSRFALIDAFTAPDSDGGSFTRDVGDLRTHTLGEPGIGRLSGYVTDGGKPVAAGRFYLSAFQAGVGRYLTSTGQALQSFSISRGASDGSWTTGAVYSGRFTISVLDSTTGHRCVWRPVSIAGIHQRVDLDFAKPSFGWPGGHCT